MVTPFNTIASGGQSWVGLPIFSAKGAYEGPIEWCDHDHSGTKIQKTNPGEAFKSGEYSAYPALLCKSLAKAIVQEWILRLNGALNTFDTPSEGRVRLVKSKIPTRTCIDEVQDLKSVVYTGRGGTNNKMGIFLPKSKWANPYKVTGKFTAEVAIRCFAPYLRGRKDLVKAIEDGELDNAVLSCHCSDLKPCHNDEIIKLCREIKRKGQSRYAVPSKENQGEDGPTSEEDEHGFAKKKKGDGWWGNGHPLRITRGESRTLFQNGGGLCSPGRWKPSSRRLPTRLAPRLLLNFRNLANQVDAELQAHKVIGLLTSGKAFRALAPNRAGPQFQ